MATIDQELECGICLQTCQDAVETRCCFNLFCQNCVADINRCPLCRKIPLFNRPNHAVRRMISRLPMKCEACHTGVERESMEKHKLNCESLQHHCSICNFVGNRKDFAKHFYDLHIQNLIETFSSNLSAISLFCEMPIKDKENKDSKVNIARPRESANGSVSVFYGRSPGGGGGGRFDDRVDGGHSEGRSPYYGRRRGGLSLTSGGRYCRRYGDGGGNDRTYQQHNGGRYEGDIGGRRYCRSNGECDGRDYDDRYGRRHRRSVDGRFDGGYGRY